MSQDRLSDMSSLGRRAGNVLIQAIADWPSGLGRDAKESGVATTFPENI
jgi:hypothetical protein